MTTLSFSDWMKKLDAYVSAKAGLSVYDLPDLAFRDLYAGGATVPAVARLALKGAK